MGKHLTWGGGCYPSGRADFFCNLPPITNSLQNRLRHLYHNKKLYECLTFNRIQL